MFVANVSREDIYKVCQAALPSSYGHRWRAAEVGVLRGENAEKIREILKPEVFYLVDQWSTKLATDYSQQNDDRSWVNRMDAYSSYFGGSQDDPATWESLYNQTRLRFDGASDVVIIRGDSRVGAEKIIDFEGGSGRLNYVYVDANHSFESAFDDLMLYSKLLSHDGLIQLNDCAHSENSIRQNCGVLEATVRFCKLMDFVPLILTNSDMSDCLLARRNSLASQKVATVIRGSNAKYVELPDSMLGAARVYKRGKFENLCFT
jgi:hypothetical protein